MSPLHVTNSEEKLCILLFYQLLREVSTRNYSTIKKDVIEVVNTTPSLSYSLTHGDGMSTISGADPDLFGSDPDPAFQTFGSGKLFLNPKIIQLKKTHRKPYIFNKNTDITD